MNRSVPHRLAAHLIVQISGVHFTGVEFLHRFHRFEIAKLRSLLSLARERGRLAALLNLDGVRRRDVERGAIAIEEDSGAAAADDQESGDTGDDAANTALLLFRGGAHLLSSHGGEFGDFRRTFGLFHESGLQEEENAGDGAAGKLFSKST